MQKIEIIALISDSKKIIERLQRRNIIELCNIQDNSLVKLNTNSSISLFEKNKTKIQQALDILNAVSPAKVAITDMFGSKRSIDKHDFGAKSAELEHILDASDCIVELSRQISELKALSSRDLLAIDNLRQWESLDIPTAFSGTKETACMIGTLPMEITKDQLEEMLPECCEVFVVASFKQQTNIVVLSLSEYKNQALEILRDNGFATVSELSEISAGERIAEIEQEIKQNDEKIDESTRKIAEFATLRPDFEFMIDYLSIRQEKYEALASLALTDETIIISGFIPQKYCDRLVNELEARFQVAIRVYEPDEEDDVPVLLENGRFSAPVEGITEMYAMPAKKDLDPTPIMAFFYYLLFGMMLSDAGYGVLMVLGTAIALKKFNFEPKMKKTLKMFQYCGISTIFWGALYGSWFGDIVQVVSKQFFGKEIGSLALWFEPLADPIKLLLFSFGIGICHLFLGLGANFYNLFKQGKKWDAVCETIPVYLTVLGVAPLAAGILTSVPPILSKIGGYVAIIGVVLIVLTTDRTSKSFIARIFGGLYGLYNIATGYLSDILSYSRLLALGLATGSIAGVINLIGTMPSNLIIKGILLVIVFIIGHVANLAINLLGAYVHTDRLQFVELFSKFYEGGGRAFNPFGIKTKFVKFKEEVINE